MPKDLRKPGLSQNQLVLRASIYMHLLHIYMHIQLCILHYVAALAASLWWIKFMHSGGGVYMFGTKPLHLEETAAQVPILEVLIVHISIHVTPHTCAREERTTSRACSTG